MSKDDQPRDTTLVDSIRAALKADFDRIDARFDDVNSRFDETSKELGSIKSDLGSLHSRLESTTAAISEKIDEALRPKGARLFSPRRWFSKN